MTKSLALLSVALLMVVSGCATARNERNVRQMQITGERYLAAGETAEALKYLTEAAEKRPKDPTIQYDLALAYDKRGLTDKAFECLKEALRIKPAYPEAQNAIGTLYAKRGQYKLAQEAFQKALDDPFYKTPQGAAYNLGSLREKNGEIESALANYQQAVKFDPRYGAAWFGIGHILEQMHRDDEARHAYGNAVASSPDMAEAHLRFGIMSYKAGDTDSALTSLSQVEKLAPNTSMADEARSYLQKLNAAASRKADESHPVPFYASPPEIENMPSAGGRPQKTQDSAPSGLPPQSAPPVQTDDLEKSQSIPLQPVMPKAPQAPAPGASPVSAGEAPPAPGGTVEGSQLQPRKYIVQVGSFTDREKAEEIRKALAAKGYSAVVKPMKHRGLGQVFVIQLQPVNSLSRATTLKTQLSGQMEGEPVIVETQ
jgi:tetratricopeptide (TPR) repeat protein